MVVESFPNFVEWINSAILLFLGIGVAATVLGIFFGYVVASFRHGAFEAFYIVAQVISQAIPDLLGTAPRRVWAIARLAIKEAMRRRVILVTFGIFALALLFGGWFMNAGSDHPDRIYVNFVLWGTQLLVLLMGLLLSAFSLPEDIKNKTIYTVVTKPVRSTEIVLGRILGFGLLGTALLALMGLISFMFVWRGLSHEHQVVGDTQTVASLYEIDPDTMLDQYGKRVSPGCIMAGETSFDSGHRHRIEVIKDIRDENSKQPQDPRNILKTTKRSDGKIVYERVVVVPYGGHSHPVTVNGEGNDATLTIGTAGGYFRARVPVYSDFLQFHDRQGRESSGIDVGREWRYRSYVDGGNRLTQNSLSRAMFDFEDFNVSRFGDRDTLPLEMTLSVFRTYKGDIEKRVIGSLQFESLVDDDSVEDRFIAEPIVFETDEYNLQVLPIPRIQSGRKVSPDGTVLEEGKFDLFKDFAANGKIRLILRCEDFNQYIGVARADLYFRATDDLFWWNFVKGYVGIWCMMIIIIAMGVALSTFLSSPVVMLSTLVIIVVGFFTTEIRKLARDLFAGEESGGGPIESLFRILTQKNMEVHLETGVGTTLMEQIDKGLVFMLEKLTYLAPDFGKLNFSDFLTYGYSVDQNRMFVALAITFGFCLGLSILGYFCLKTREIAK